MIEHRLRLSLLALPMLAALAVTPRAHAAPPGTTECLAATESSLKMRKAHKLRDARRQFFICASASCPSDVKADCTRGIAEINAAVPTVVFTVKSGAGDELFNVKITMDGEAVADHLDGTALTLDPGSHEFTFAAEGQPAVTRTIVLHEAEKDRRETVIVGAAAPAPIAAVPVVVPLTPAVPPPVQTEPPPSDSTQGGGLRTAGYVFGGAGVVAVVVGAIVGGLAISDSSSAKGECTNTCANNTNPTATNDMQTASTLATVSTATFIAGGALVVGGLAMVLFGGPKKTTTGLLWSPTVMAHGGGMGVGGAW